ncbi:MAG TPA: beta-1,6-N-acetylglucosaminyltransferase [Stellaceae bacterium]|jgi:hypothetical protein|nr:beta-1,6-N-acetylglucosaminyltransferase [Stellaceae bacterium]
MIAYLITAHHNIANLYSLMATIHEDRHLYLIYIDGDTKPEYLEQISGLLAYPNVYLKHGDPIGWNMTSILDATLWGMATLHRLSADWHHFVLLSGDDIATMPQRALETRLQALPPDACFISVTENPTGAGLFEQIEHANTAATSEHLFTKPFGPTPQRMTNRSRAPGPIFTRKLRFMSSPRSSFVWHGFGARIIQNFAEVPELGLAINRPLPWFLGQVRDSVVEKTGWARGPAWVVLSRSFCDYVLNDPLPKLVYAALRSSGAFDETFFQMLIISAPARFKEAWKNEMLTFCNWKGDLILREDDIGSLRRNPGRAFCRKITPGESDAVVTYALKNLIPENPPAILGYRTGNGASRRLAIADVFCLRGTWKMVNRGGTDLGTVTLSDTGDIVDNRNPTNESKWTAEDGKVRFLAKDRRVSTEFYFVSTDGTDAFLSGDFLLQAGAGIGHTIYAPLRDRFLAECDGEMLSLPLVNPAGPGKFRGSHFRMPLMADLHADEFHWQDHYLTDATADLVVEGGGLQIPRADSAQPLHCSEIHAQADNLLVVFSPLKPRGPAVPAPLTGTSLNEMCVRFGTGDLTRNEWLLTGCEIPRKIRFNRDQLVLIDGVVIGFWKLRAGRLLILGTAGFMAFDKLAWCAGSLSLIGSVRTAALNAAYVRLTAGRPL